MPCIEKLFEFDEEYNKLLLTENELQARHDLEEEINCNYKKKSKKKISPSN